MSGACSDEATGGTCSFIDTIDETIGESIMAMLENR